jgi:ABC-type nickel/cobalt efflux system permease component RcnA
MSTEVSALLVATFSVALFHTMSPDHWLPFVMVGRSQKWSILKTESVALAAGIGHVGTSAIISLVGVFIGAELSERFASITETATGVALIVFGFAYALYMWRKGGHVHLTIGGDRFTAGHAHVHAGEYPSSSQDHGHDHVHRHSRDELEPDHEHENNHGEHVHSHNVDLPQGTKAPYTLVAIMGLTPCVALLPLAFAAASHSTGVVLGVIALFAIATVIPILVLTFLSSAGLSFVRLSWFERYGDIITGIVIGCVGLMTMFLGL